MTPLFPKRSAKVPNMKPTGISARSLAAGADRRDRIAEPDVTGLARGIKHRPIAAQLVLALQGTTRDITAATGAEEHATTAKSSTA